MDSGVVIMIAVITGLLLLAIAIAVLMRRTSLRNRKQYERGLKMVPLLIHLPPSTDDIQQGGRDERDLTEEIVSQAQVMYSILASTLTKGMNANTAMPPFRQSNRPVKKTGIPFTAALSAATNMRMTKPTPSVTTGVTGASLSNRPAMRTARKHGNAPDAVKRIRSLSTPSAMTGANGP